MNIYVVDVCKVECLIHECKIDEDICTEFLEITSLKNVVKTARRTPPPKT